MSFKCASLTRANEIDVIVSDPPQMIYCGETYNLCDESLAGDISEASCRFENDRSFIVAKGASNGFLSYVEDITWIRYMLVPRTQWKSKASHVL